MRQQLALFDTRHGQPNWIQTGFPSRELHSNFSGIGAALSEEGFQCAPTRETSLKEQLSAAAILVIPPATGDYIEKRQTWKRTSETLFHSGEISDILSFVARGRSLLAFGYRFGDSFTNNNIGQLFAALGCILNDDAVINLPTLRSGNILQSEFQTDCWHMPPWAAKGITRVRWRSCATFTILPEASAYPLAVSPGGACICFDRVSREISFGSRPIAVSGSYGKGRFALFGGPHVLEAGPFGLLNHADNQKFLRNVTNWLMGNDAVHCTASGLGAGREGAHRDGNAPADIQSVIFVERLLKRTGTFSALGKRRLLASSGTAQQRNFDLRDPHGGSTSTEIKF